jgi:hypothetical protein
MLYGYPLLRVGTQWLGLPEHAPCPAWIYSEVAYTVKANASLDQQTIVDRENQWRVTEKTTAIKKGG